MSSAAFAPAAARLLDVAAVHRRYRRGDETVSALNGVSFRLDAGETLAVVGESGCGKSTLARLVVGLECPDEGSVRFEGADPASARGRHHRALRARLQMVFQDSRSALNPALRVEQLVGEPLAIHGEPGMPRWGWDRRRWMRRRVEQWLERVGLDPALRRRFPADLSGGQRQRVAIARATILAPRLVVADEILSALDVATASQIVNLLLDLQRDLGVAYLFISHDLAWVRQMARRMLVMQSGVVVESGDVDPILRSPVHDLTRSLVAAAPRAW